VKPILRLIPHVAAALAIAAALACGERAGNGGDLPVLRERGSIRLLAPRLAAEDDLYDHGELLRRERVLADAFVQLQGLQPDWVLLDRYEDLLPALLDGRGDIVVAGLTATPERQERVAFSAPLAFVQERVVTRAGTPAVTTLDDLAGRTIAVRRSSSFWETLADVGADYPDIEVVEAPEDLDTEEILYRVSTGEYDATVADDIRIGSAQTYLDNLSEGIALTEDRAIAWAIRPDSPELLSAIDSFVREFNPESRHPERYLGDLPEIKQRKILRVLTRKAAEDPAGTDAQLVVHLLRLARSDHGLRVRPGARVREAAWATGRVRGSSDASRAAHLAAAGARGCCRRRSYAHRRSGELRPRLLTSVQLRLRSPRRSFCRFDAARTERSCGKNHRRAS
jgi:membrane-bound lytic murein transglycosylase F